ncbi:MAG TPA: hypothetical protein DDZ51_17335 [Planctomycetaceae bacterium]|nr:hypothetical protein [Planctomycetaceae bacterium]
MYNGTFDLGTAIRLRGVLSLLSQYYPTQSKNCGQGQMVSLATAACGHGDYVLIFSFESIL